MAKFSIVVPVYNVEDYLEKCVNSILKQKYKDYELVLVDDGSTDKSGAICDRLASENKDKINIKVVHQENKGLGGARNTGIENAIGEYLFFIDSDDTIVDGTLQELSIYVDKHEVDIVVFDIVKVNENNEVLYTIPGSVNGNIISTTEENKSLILTDHSACNKIIKRSLFVENCIRFPERLWFEDVATIFKLFPYAKIGYIHKAYYVYLERIGSIMNSEKCDKNIDMVTAMNSTLSYYKEKSLFEKYYDELEYIAAFHLYYLSSIRVMRVDSKHRLLKIFKEYIDAEFPNFRQNKYLGKKEKIIIKLLDKKMYSTINFVFSIKGKINSLRK